MSIHTPEILGCFHSIDRIMYSLEDLAVAFRMTGNREVAERLEEVVATVNKISKEGQGLAQDSLGDMVNQSWQGTVNVFQAALAGISIGEKANESQSH